MNRREFQLSLLKLSAGAVFAPRLLRSLPASASPDIAKLYERAIVVDSLCSPFLDQVTAPSAELVAVVRQSGITAVNYTVSDTTFEGTINNLAWLDALVEKYTDAFSIIRRHSDIARAKQEKKVGIIPGFQYTAFLEEKPERIGIFRNLGVRIMQLTYNVRTAFGDGCLEPGNAGLSRAGISGVMEDERDRSCR